MHEKVTGNIIPDTLRPVDKPMADLCCGIAFLAQVPVDNFFRIAKGSDRLNTQPFSATFGAKAQFECWKQLRDQTQQNVPINYAGIFTVLHTGLGRKDSESQEETTPNCFEVIRALEFYGEMAGLINQEVFNTEVETLEVATTVAAAIEGLDEDKLLHFGEETVKFNPNINSNIIRVLNKRAVLLRTKNVLEERKDYKLLVKSLHNLEVIYDKKAKPEARSEAESLWWLHHVIIPGKKAFDEITGTGLRIRGEWHELAQGEAFSRVQERAAKKLVGSGHRPPKKRRARGRRGPRRYSKEEEE